MTRQSFPEIPHAALKSHAQPERVERVWRRLKLDMSATPRKRAASYWWMPVAAASIFGLGVAVGVRLHTPVVEVAAVAEPRAPLATPGAGPAVEPVATTQQRHAEPARKHPQARHAAPVGDSAESYPESYEPAVVVNEPAPVVEFAEWEKLAEAGDFKAAKAALDRDGGLDRAAARATASQLLVLADIARASGNREQASQALRRVLSAYVSAPEAPLAAWTLGNLLEQAGDRSGAAEAYATYRRLSPTGDFAEDAAARQVDAALSQGNLELGRRTLEEYAEHFPKGRRLAELRQRLAAAEAPAADGTASPPVDSDESDDDAAEPAAAPEPATVP